MARTKSIPRRYIAPKPQKRKMMVRKQKSKNEEMLYTMKPMPNTRLSEKKKKQKDTLRKSDGSHAGKDMSRQK